MSRRLAWSGGLAAVGAAAWLPLASTALCTTLGRLRQTDPWVLPVAGFFYWRDYGAEPSVAHWLPVCAVAAAVVAAIPAFMALCWPESRRLRPARIGEDAPQPVRAYSDLHGQAKWLTIAGAKAIFTGDDRRWGSIPVGEAYRPDQDRTAKAFDENEAGTWGMGGRAPLLSTPLTKGAISGIIIAGSGSYKTMAFTVPAMTTWRGSVVVLDPSGQVGPMTAAVREQMGHQVVLLDPDRPGLGGFDALGCIDIQHPLAPVHIAEFVGWCAPEGEKPGKAEEGFFAEAGMELACCLLADLLWDDALPKAQRTMREWRRRIVLPEDEMPAYLASIYAHSKSAYARDLAGTLMRVYKKTFSGIYKHATTATKWLSIPAYADLLSGDAFDPAALTSGKLSVFLQIPDEAMKATPGVARVIIGALGRTMLRAQGKTATPVPFILDEVDLLKHMAILAVLRDMGRKSGVALFPMWQSAGQIEKTWGKDGKKAWYASAAWRMYASVNDDETAKEVSDRCGTYTVLTRTQSTSSSTQGGASSGSRTQSRSDNLVEQRRELLSPYEVQTAVRPDEAIIIPRGHAALRCGRPLWWRRPAMKALIEADRYRVAAE